MGKEPGAASVAQDEIADLLIDRARQGKIVVRLKGGDPFVFGRGGEEAEALAEAEIPFEVVPGVTAGVAAPAYAGIPVTHRDDASAVAFVTGHEDPEKEDSALDYEALADFPGTLVFYMGVKALPRIAERLIEAGRDASEPAAVVERGTLPGQLTVTSTLEGIAAAAEEAGIEPPSVTVVGPVAGAARADRLARAPAAARQEGRRHPSASAGQRARPPARRARRRVDRAPGDPDRAADRLRRGPPRGRGPAYLRARLPDQPQRCAPAVRGDGGPGPRRPRPGQRQRGGDRCRDRGRPRGERCPRRHRARAVRGGGAGRGARQTGARRASRC